MLGGMGLIRTYIIWGLLLLPAGGSMAAENDMVVEIKDAPAKEKPQTPPKTKIYRNYNANGVVEFSDQPKPGGEPVKIPTLPTYQAPPRPRVIPSTSRKKQQKDKAWRYRSIKIEQPKSDSVIRNNAGQLNVKVQLQPALTRAAGHQIHYYLNGKRVMTSSNTSVTLNSVDRGTHKLHVRVVDETGRKLIESRRISFTMLRYFKPRSKLKEAIPKLVEDVFGDDDV